MQDIIVPSVLDSISTRPYHAGELFVGFLTNQANNPLTLSQVLWCDSEGGRATRMAPDATTGKIRYINKSIFNSRQVVRSNPFMRKEAPSGGKSRQQIIVHQQPFHHSIYLA